MNVNDKIILVTGATGQQGGAVTRHLLADGWQVRAVSRDPGADKARWLRELGLEIKRGDLTSPGVVAQAMEGVYGVFAMGTPFEHGVEHEIEQGTTLGEAAKAAGVKHYIYSSVGGADRQSGVPHFVSKWQVEEHLRSLELPLTVLRPAFFMENLLGRATQRSEQGRTIAMPLAPETRLQMIAVDDIGGLTAALFAQPQRFIGTALEIAGDELTMPEAAARLAAALDERVEYERIPYATVRQQSNDMALMYEWFEHNGYRADIDDLRNLYPNLHTFAAWAGETATTALNEAA